MFIPTLGRFGLAIACLFVLPGAARAQAPGAPPPDDGSKPGGIQIIVSQKLWAATWDVGLLDARVVVPSGGGTPTVQTSLLSDVSSVKVMPLTAIAARYGDFTLSASGMPRTRFGNSAAPNGHISRSEYDLSLSYAITPNITGALIYKAGRVSESSTAVTTAILGVSGPQKLHGVLLGVSASAPIQPRLNLYGNVAMGPGKSTVSFSRLGDVNADITYQIGEIGLSYILHDGGGRLAGFSALSLQLGYRAQVVRIKAEFPTLSTGSTPTVISMDHRRVQSTTQGVILGITGVF